MDERDLKFEREWHLKGYWITQITHKYLITFVSRSLCEVLTKLESAADICVVNLPNNEKNKDRSDGLLYTQTLKSAKRSGIPCVGVKTLCRFAAAA